MKPSQGGHPKTLIGIAFQHGGTFVILGTTCFRFLPTPIFSYGSPIAQCAGGARVLCQTSACAVKGGTRDVHAEELWLCSRRGRTRSLRWSSAAP